MIKKLTTIIVSIVAVGLVDSAKSDQIILYSNSDSVNAFGGQEGFYYANDLVRNYATIHNYNSDNRILALDLHPTTEPVVGAIYRFCLSVRTKTARTTNTTWADGGFENYVEFNTLTIKNNNCSDGYAANIKINSNYTENINGLIITSTADDLRCVSLEEFDSIDKNYQTSSWVNTLDANFNWQDGTLIEHTDVTTISKPTAITVATLTGLTKLIATSILAFDLYGKQISGDIIDIRNRGPPLGGMQMTINSTYDDPRLTAGYDYGFDYVVDNSIHPLNQIFMAYMEESEIKFDYNYASPVKLGEEYIIRLSLEDRIGSGIIDADNFIYFDRIIIDNDSNVKAYSFETYLKPEFTKNLDNSPIIGVSDGNGYVLFESGFCEERTEATHIKTSLPGNFSGDYGYPESVG